MGCQLMIWAALFASQGWAYQRCGSRAGFYHSGECIGIQHLDAVHPSFIFAITLGIGRSSYKDRKSHEKGTVADTEKRV